jgi:excisionase family DNA binding protein
MPKTRKGAKTPPGADHGLLSTGAVARLCGVTRDGVAHWIRSGRLQAFRTPGGHFRVRAEDLRAFLRSSRSGERAGRPEDAPCVLVVDDEAGVRALVSDVLSDAGFRVMEAPAAGAALDLAASHRPDLVIADVNLPGMPGTELTRALRRRPEMAGVPIIAVTGLFEDGMTARVYDAGADLLLAKPFRPDQLLGEVRRLLHRDGPGLAEERP